MAHPPPTVGGRVLRSNVLGLALVRQSLLHGFYCRPEQRAGTSATPPRITTSPACAANARAHQTHRSSQQNPPPKPTNTTRHPLSPRGAKRRGGLMSHKDCHVAPSGHSSQ